MKITENIIDKIEHMKERVFISVLFITAFIFRLPTLFNDFYDVDELAAIVQTKEFLAGFKPGIDFTESKLPLYHSIFKFSYSVDAVYGWVGVHAITIIIVFLTALAVYYIGKLVRDRKTGMIAALLYAVLISSFNRHFMATNGEVIYNLPITAGILVLLLAVKNRTWVFRVIYGILLGLMIYAAMKVKVHGAVLLLFTAFFILIYIPYYYKKFRRLLLIYSVFAVVILLVIIFDYFITKKFAPKSVNNLLQLLFYATAGRSSNPLFLLAVFSYKQLTIGLWHAVLWIPAAVYIYRFIRNRFRKDSIEESAVALFGLITFFMVFAGGARLYYHYFMTSYPSLCIIAAIAICSYDNSAVRKIRNNLTVALLIPGLFFLSWNFKDIYIKHFNQALFYNESKAAFWFRAIAVSSMDDYLLPNGAYSQAVEYIKTKTDPSDTIFVWGDGPHLYYFSDRRIAVKHVWPRNSAIKIERFYSQKTPESIVKAEVRQKVFIKKMEVKKPELFIDTSPKGLSRGVTKFGDFAKFPYEVPPVIRKYLERHYRFEAVINEYKIYRRVK